jgi:hypothetical protein
MGKTLAIVVVWACVLGGMALAYKHFVLDWDDTNTNPTTLAAKTNGTQPAKSGSAVRLAGDSFSGYCLFRAPEFQKRLAGQGVDYEWVDDKADYAKRMGTIQSGQTPLAVITIDAILTHLPPAGDPPAIILLIDETVGADAMVAYPEGVNDVAALNSPNAKVVLTEGSPSETLFRVVRSQFDLSQLPPRKKDYLIPANPDKGAEDVYQQLLVAPHAARKAFVLWEPYVSLAKAAGAKVLVDSSRFRGFIVDVLVVQPQYLREHSDRVAKVVQTYLEMLHKRQSSARGMADLVLSDAQNVINEGNINTPEKAQQVADGIWWKNTKENYAHFGLLPPQDAKGMQPVLDMIQRITGVLDKTKEPGEPSPGVGRPDKLIKDQFVRQLYERPPLYVHEERLREVVKLQDVDWATLRRVANFPVRNIDFSSKRPSGLGEEAEEQLAELAETLRNLPQYYLRIEGHTEKQGEREANMVLGQERADLVRDYLVKRLGIDESRVQAKAMEPGEGKLVRFVALEK